MKYIRHYTTIGNATADTSLVSPYIGYCEETGKVLLQNSEEKDTPLEIKVVDNDVVVEEKTAYITGINHSNTDVSGYAKFSEGVLKPKLIYGITGTLEDKNNSGYTIDRIIKVKNQYFSMFSDLNDFENPTVTLSAWYRTKGEEKTETYSCTYQPEISE